MFKRLIASFVIVCFMGSIPTPYLRAAEVASSLHLPLPGTMVNLSSAYEPTLIKGLTLHKENPFLFDFIVDTGHSGLAGNDLKREGERLVKYFFACLTIPEKDLWVNLSPYEKDRMVPHALGQTALGRDLLAQDYILKQLTASLIYPEKALGKKFWDRIYAKAQQLYGNTQIPVNTFNKVWIMVDKATVYEHDQTAYVLDGHLKVMLEEDYLALSKNVSLRSPAGGEAILTRTTNPNKIASLPTVVPQRGPIGRNDTSILGSQIVRDVVLPELEKEVNTGKNFAMLRQIFNSLILASWYKKNLRNALLNQVYSNKNTVKGVNVSDPSIKEQIYQQYLKAYKKGVFNYIKEDVDAQSGQSIPRKYFSGGFLVKEGFNPQRVTANMPGARAMVSSAFAKTVSLAMITVALFFNRKELPSLPSIKKPTLATMTLPQAVIGFGNSSSKAMTTPSNPEEEQNRAALKDIIDYVHCLLRGETAHITNFSRGNFINAFSKMFGRKPVENTFSMYQRIGELSEVSMPSVEQIFKENEHLLAQGSAGIDERKELAIFFGFINMIRAGISFDYQRMRTELEFSEYTESFYTSNLYYRWRMGIARGQFGNGNKTLTSNQIADIGEAIIEEQSRAIRQREKTQLQEGVLVEEPLLLLFDDFVFHFGLGEFSPSLDDTSIRNEYREIYFSSLYDELRLRLELFEAKKIGKATMEEIAKIGQEIILAHRRKDSAAEEKRQTAMRELRRDFDSFLDRREYKQAKRLIKSYEKDHPQLYFDERDLIYQLNQDYNRIPESLIREQIAKDRDEVREAIKAQEGTILAELNSKLPQGVRCEGLVVSDFKDDLNVEMSNIAYYKLRDGSQWEDAKRYLIDHGLAEEITPEVLKIDPKVKGTPKPEEIFAKKAWEIIQEHPILVAFHNSTIELNLRDILSRYIQGRFPDKVFSVDRTNVASQFAKVGAAFHLNPNLNLAMTSNLADIKSSELPIETQVAQAFQERLDHLRGRSTEWGERPMTVTLLNMLRQDVATSTALSAEVRKQLFTEIRRLTDSVQRPEVEDDTNRPPGGDFPGSEDAAMTTNKELVTIDGPIDGENLLNQIRYNDDVNAAKRFNAYTIFIAGIPRTAQDELLKTAYFQGMKQLDVRELNQPEKVKDFRLALEKAIAGKKEIVLHHFSENAGRTKTESPVMEVFTQLRDGRVQGSQHHVLVLAEDSVDLRLFPGKYFGTNMPFYNYPVYFAFNGTKIVEASEPKDIPSLMTGEMVLQKRINRMNPGEEISLSLRGIIDFQLYDLPLRARQEIFSQSSKLEPIDLPGVWRRKSDTAMNAEIQEKTKRKIVDALTKEAISTHKLLSASTNKLLSAAYVLKNSNQFSPDQVKQARDYIPLAINRLFNRRNLMSSNTGVLADMFMSPQTPSDVKRILREYIDINLRKPPAWAGSDIHLSAAVKYDGGFDSDKEHFAWNVIGRNQDVWIKSYYAFLFKRDGKINNILGSYNAATIREYLERVPLDKRFPREYEMDDLYLMMDFIVNHWQEVKPASQGDLQIWFTNLVERILTYTVNKEYRFRGIILLHKYSNLIKPDSLEQIANYLDAAMETNVSVAAVVAPAYKGGIDLNTANMGMTVTKDSNGGVKVNFDPAMAARIREEGIQSAEPMIIRVRSVTSKDISPLLGLAPV